MKYIDAEKLKGFVRELKERAKRNSCDTWGIVPDALEEVENFIDSLQQDLSEVDLEKEFEMQADHFPPAIINELSDDGKIRLHKELYAFARHFAQWGAEHLKK